MFKLFAFVKKFRFAFLFLGFQFIALFLLFSQNTFHKFIFADYIGSVSGGLLSGKSTISNYLELEEINETLLDENRKLRLRIGELNRVIDQNKVIKNWPESSIGFVPSQVIHRFNYKGDKFFTINRGKNQGIKKDMGVLSGKSIVGKVYQVTNEYAVILSLFHHSFFTSVKVGNPPINEILQLKRKGDNFLTISSIPIHENVEVGDTVWTNGLSVSFPENTPIGRVLRLEKNTNNQFVHAYVEPFQSIRDLHYVYVIQNSLIDSALNLQADIGQ